MIAALFVETDGCYFGLPGVDPWDKARDARLYAGPWPVVAHPPCERWGRYWHGGPSARERRKLGDDDGCFASALASVRRWGGVLEHPEGSHAFAHHSLSRPNWRQGWEPNIWDASGIGRLGHKTANEYVCCVAQGHYGHRARKLTWLFVAGVPSYLLPPLNWLIPEPRSRLDYGFHSAEERAARKGDVAPRVNASRLTAAENLATPLAFRDVLLSIARAAIPTQTARAAH